MSTVAKEANAEVGLFRATVGRQNLHRATQRLVSKELKELERLTNDGHLQEALWKNKIEGGTAQCPPTSQTRDCPCCHLQGHQGHQDHQEDPHAGQAILVPQADPEDAAAGG